MGIEKRKTGWRVFYFALEKNKGTMGYCFGSHKLNEIRD
jgi:hypothetical protein